MRDRLKEDLLKFVKGWAETTTEEESPSDSVEQLANALDNNCILRAREILKKHKIEFNDPSEE